MTIEAAYSYVESIFALDNIIVPSYCHAETILARGCSPWLFVTWDFLHVTLVLGLLSCRKVFRQVTIVDFTFLVDAQLNEIMRYFFT